MEGGTFPLYGQVFLNLFQLNTELRK